MVFGWYFKNRTNLSISYNKMILNENHLKNLHIFTKHTNKLRDSFKIVTKNTPINTE